MADDVMKKQVGGDHYVDSEVQPIEVIMSKNLNFQIGSVVKYIARRNRKNNSTEDLKKAVHYLEFELHRISNPTEYPNLPDIIDAWELDSDLTKVVELLTQDVEDYAVALRECIELLNSELKYMETIKSVTLPMQDVAHCKCTKCPYRHTPNMTQEEFDRELENAMMEKSGCVFPLCFTVVVIILILYCIL